VTIPPLSAALPQTPAFGIKGRASRDGPQPDSGIAK
jgi:hypothetical protein